MLFHRIAATLLSGLCVLLGILFPAHAQEQCRWIATHDTLRLDSLPVLPHSIRIASPAAGVPFRFDTRTQQLYFLATPGLPDSVLVCYRVVLLPLQDSYAKRSMALIDSSSFFRPVAGQNTLPANSMALLGSDSLHTSGVIARGLSVGTGNTAQFNSTLNLQIEGKLSEQVQLRASITDRQLPYEPEGNTQQIQDFDNILIEFIHQNGSLQLGDVVLSENDDYFLRFRRNVQGGYLQTHYAVGKHKAQSKAGFAIAKGKFHSAFIQPIEGVLGPYRLRGGQNERFILILAGSEKVYLDGKLLERGFDRDYVIDYNQAEITFNPHIVITQFSRIRVDYQYTDRTYSRLTGFVQQTWESRRSHTRLSYYIETDNPNQPLLFSLRPEDKQQLALVGDQSERAFITAADTVSFSPDLVLYKKIDTLTASGLYEGVFVYTTEPGAPVYQVRFSEVGPNKGNYVLSSSLANGQVFQWVEPQNGIPQGNYAPVTPVRLPEKRSMWHLHHSRQLSWRQRITIDLAHSLTDRNLYSPIDDGDNAGYAGRLHYQIEHPTLDSLRRRESGFIYEYNSPSFSFIDRFRPVEFNRDWSLPYDTTRLNQQSEHIVGWYSHFDGHHTGYRAEVNYRRRDKQLEGWQSRIRWKSEFARWVFEQQFFGLYALLYADSLQSQRQSRWWRSYTRLQYKGKHIQPAVIADLDHNKIIQSSNDSITFSAMHYQALSGILQSPDTARFRWQLMHTYREDYRPKEGSMQLFAYANTTQADINRQGEQQSIEARLTYRHLLYADSLRNEENWAARLAWESRSRRKQLQQRLIYQHGSGRELKRTFAFIQVPVGQGTHTWRDDNGDGVAQLNEFYLALNPDEKNYIKVFTPTDEYVTAYSSDWYYRLQWQFPGNGAFKALSGLSNWQLNQKVNRNDGLARWLPFFRPADEALLSRRELLRNTVFWNRSHPVYGITINQWQSSQRQLLTQGYETRREENYEISVRWQWHSQWQLVVSGAIKDVDNRSDVFLNRNFAYRVRRTQAENTWQPGRRWRLRPSLIYQQKEGNENVQAWWYEGSMDIQWSNYPHFNIQGQLSFIRLTYTEGDLNTPLAYELLESLAPGNNWRWQLQWQQKLSSGLQLTFGYQGRKLPGSRIIHFGNVRAALLF
ncbi:hypothetical protein [Thermonema rossianum]|uniref:hypothetical protein n=1 Tax=Thermonema rossianum TaxID=55505 RepID=UPI00056E0BA6|nr:hypothetical protein [Thermonema rossianum]